MGTMERNLVQIIFFAEVEPLLSYGVGYPDLVMKLREKVHWECLDH